MVELTFGKLEVATYHSFLNTGNMDEAWENYKTLSKVFKGDVDLKTGFGYCDPDDNGPAINVNFDNTDLHCELVTVDSLDANSDSFKFTVWNIPEETIFYLNDVITFKYYWESDPSRFSIYHGRVEFTKAERSGGDVKTVIQGKLIHQNILYHWSAFKVYKKIQYYSELKDVLFTELGLVLNSSVGELGRRISLENPILTHRTTIGEIIDQICEELGVEWRLINHNEVLIYTREELELQLLNERYDVEVLTIDYNDILDLSVADDAQFKFKMYGLPMIKPGTVIIINTDNTPDFVTLETTSYVIDEVESTITLRDGFMTTCYIHKVGVEDDDES